MKVAINPGILEALGRIGSFAGGLNSAIDAHDKLVKKRVIRPIIGGRKTVKRSKRNSSVAHLDLPDDIVSRLGAETVDAIFASEDPAGTIDALMTVAAAEDDYWALNDYTRLLAIMLAGGAIETEAREIKENPFDLFGKETRPKRVQTTGYCLGCTVDYGKGTGVVTQSFRDNDGVQWFEVKPQRGGLKAVRASDVRIQHNPTYTVHVSTPSVNESVEVKGPFLTTGGALRRGKHKLRSAAKVQPKWSVERNPYESGETKPEELSEIQREALSLMYEQNIGAIAVAPFGYVFPAHIRNDGGQFGLENAEIAAAAIVARLTAESNPAHKRGRKGGSYAVLVNPSEEVLRLRRLFTEADNRLEEARFYGTEKQVHKASKLRERLLTNLRRVEQKERQGKRNSAPELAPATKSKLNKVSSMFHGPANPAKGHISREYISDHVKARNFSRAGSIPGIKLEVDATGKHADPSHMCEECTILTNPNTSKLGISTGLKVQPMGSGVRAAGKRLKNKLDRMNPDELAEHGITRKGDSYNLGKANTQWYTTIEKWSDIEDPDLINYYHEWAEETKRYEDKPDAILDENGMIYFRGGKHTVTEAGIEN